MKKSVFNVDMSLEQSLLVRISKDDAATLEEAKALVKERLEKTTELVVSEKLKMINSSMDESETNVDVGLAKEEENHFKVAANYITLFNFDMKGVESSIAQRSEDIIKCNAKLDFGDMDVEVLATYAQHLTASEVDASLLADAEEELTV